MMVILIDLERLNWELNKLSENISKDFIYVRTKVISFVDEFRVNGGNDVFDISDLKQAFTEIPKEITDKLFLPIKRTTFTGAMILNQNRLDGIGNVMGTVADTYVSDDGIEVLMAFDKKRFKGIDKEFNSKFEASMSCTINPSSGEVSNVGLGIFPKTR